MGASDLCSLSASTISPSPQMAENDSHNGDHHIIHERLIPLAFFKELASPASQTQDDEFEKTAQKTCRDMPEDDDPICRQADV